MEPSQIWGTTQVVIVPPFYNIYVKSVQLRSVRPLLYFLVMPKITTVTIPLKALFTPTLFTPFVKHNSVQYFYQLSHAAVKFSHPFLINSTRSVPQLCTGRNQITGRGRARGAHLGLHRFSFINITNC